MKYIFFVTTVGSITKAVLPLIEERKNKGEILIIAANDESELFFRNYTDFKVIRMKVHPNLITRKTKHKLFSNIIKSKSEYKKVFSNFKNCEIYFFGHSFSLVIYSYVRKLSKNNRIFHWGGPQSEEKIVKYPVEKSFRAFIMRCIAKYFMGVEIVVRNKMGVPFWSISDKFYKNRDIQIIDDDFIQDTSVKEYMIKMDILKGKKILLAVEDSVLAGTINEAEFVKKMDRLMDVLDDSAFGDYVIKPHPRLNKLYGKMSHCEDIIPPYVPFELVLNHSWKYIIGLDSTSLLSATRDTNAKVISLMDLIEYRNEKDKKMFRNWLTKEPGRKILFPSDMAELKKLLEG